MNKQAVPSQPSTSPDVPLPDLNHQIYPYDLVQSILDQTANFSMFALPDPQHQPDATLTPQTPDDWYGLNGGYGLDLRSSVHRFESVVRVGGEEFKAAQAIGERTGTMRSRWFFSPNDHKWSPGKSPAPWIFDPWRSQQFVMSECELTFGDEHSCQCYGMGRTFPINVGGRHILLAGAVANVIKGTGRFAGREGTLVCTGTITSDLGFYGNINLRVRDAEQTIVTEDKLAPITTERMPDVGNTFIELRLAKKDSSVQTTYGPPPGNDQVSLITPSEMRSVRYSYTSGTGGPRTQMTAGQLLGPMEATVFFNLLAPPGTAEAPASFTTQELYTFKTPQKHIVGTISCGVVQGYSFSLNFPSAPGQPGMRFAGIGPIEGGTGIFAGAQGMLTVNSLIGISPHALSLMHVLHLVDPSGRFTTMVGQQQMTDLPGNREISRGPWE